MSKTVRIGAGMAFYGDTILPALEVAKKGNVGYICFDDLSELTMAILQKDTQRNPALGFTRDITTTMETLLPECAPRHIRLITNAGGINPKGAAAEVVRVAGKLGLHGLRIGVVTGDNLIDKLDNLIEECGGLKDMDSGLDISQIRDRLLFASAYLGADPIVEALRRGADIVLTGRTTDSAQFAAPLIYEFGWGPEDWDKRASAVVLGHLMECTGQATGGNFSADWWNVKDLANIGYPICEVEENGSFTMTKTPGTGGRVSIQTVREQFLYEVHNPTKYITPDVIADFTTAVFQETGPDQVRVSGVRGMPAPPTLKVLMGYANGFANEGMMGYSWPDALAKAQKAEAILRAQIEQLGLRMEEIHASYLGYNSLHGPLSDSSHVDDLNEVYLRMAVRTQYQEDAMRFARLLPPLAINGPAFGGGGLGGVSRPRQLLGLFSALVAREWIERDVKVEIVEV
jgi:hypothetical protein